MKTKVTDLRWNLHVKKKCLQCISRQRVFNYPIKWFSSTRKWSPEGMLNLGRTQILVPIPESLNLLWEREEKFQFPLDLTRIEKETKAITFSLEIWKCVKALNKTLISKFTMRELSLGNEAFSYWDREGAWPGVGGGGGISNVKIRRKSNVSGSVSCIYLRST